MSTQLTFLYIEDEPASRRVMALLIKEVMGYEVVILENSADVNAQLEAHPQEYAAIFLDLNVEPISGFDLLSQLKGHPRCASTPIVALTASTNPAYMRKARNAGFDGMIGKPISPNRFPEQVRRLMAGEAIWELEE